MIKAEPDARQCPACDGKGEAASPIAKYCSESWRLGACGTCGFVFLLNPPPSEALIDELAFEKTFYQQRTRRRSTTREVAAWTRRQLAKFKRNGSNSIDMLFRSGRVLDIGCGGGRRLQPPAIPYGIEISRRMFEVADEHMRARGGFCLHATGSEGITQFGADFFDGILMHSYLEHELEVVPVLRHAHRCLKANGKVFIRVPNYASLNRHVFGRKWCGFRFPDHVNYFTPRSLGNVARKTGFRLKILNRIRLPVDDNIHALLTKAH